MQHVFTYTFVYSYVYTLGNLCSSKFSQAHISIVNCFFFKKSTAFSTNGCSCSSHLHTYRRELDQYLTSIKKKKKKTQLQMHQGPKQKS